MQEFKGFTPGKKHFTRIPAEFFTELLPHIDDANELKLTLFCFWALEQKTGEYRYLQYQDFTSNAWLMQGFGDDTTEAETALKAALQQMIKRKTLLVATIDIEGEPYTLYFMNTPKGRAAIQQIEAGQWRPDKLQNPVEILPPRPSIYVLYEENIGPLTQLISEALRDAEQEYPIEWIKEAIEIAVFNNKRNWHYIQAILRRWEQEGKSREINKTNSGGDGTQYASGKYADIITH